MALGGDPVQVRCVSRATGRPRITEESTTIPAERIHRFVFEGFGYQCRVLENPAPRTEPIVVVGGAYQDLYAYRRLEPAWTEIATVVTVDLPGSGTADSLPPNYGFDFLSAALGHLQDRLGFPRINIFGASYGTHIAYGLALQRPDGVARLALGGCAPAYPAARLHDLQVAMDSLRAGDLSTYGSLCADALMCPQERPIRNRAAVARVIARAMSDVTKDDIPRHLHSTCRLHKATGLPPGGITGVPALCFTGEYDHFTVPDLGRQVAASIDGAVFTLVRGADHLANLERGPEVARLLACFYADQPLDGLDFLTPLEYPSAEFSGASTAAAPAAAH